MIKLAIFADLHLSESENACQYAAFRFAVDSIKANSPDAVVFLGDALCSGDIKAAERFLSAMEEIKLPKLFILGNSDIRTPQTRNDVKMLETEKQINVGGVKLLGLNSSDQTLSAQDKALLTAADGETIVFMHHPPKDMDCKELIESKIPSIKALVYGHLHETAVNGNLYSVQALDPDKAIGEPPCVTYMVIEDGKIDLQFDYFPFKPFEEIEKYIGLSCFDLDAIKFAAENGIKNIEMRPDFVEKSLDELQSVIEDWRKSGGKYLSLHLPDFGYADGVITGEKTFCKAIEAAKELGVNGVTVHVPKVEVGLMNGEIKNCLLNFICKEIQKLPETCAVGIENMHMTASEKADEHRRFGYTPPECTGFVDDINAVFGYERVGILLDVGHARNNSPYSQRYSLGEWYAQVGSATVGYHIHQVVIENGKFENHTAVKSLVDPLISFCGLAYCWNNGLVNKKPLFLEIRGGRSAYEPSVKCFIDFII